MNLALIYRRQAHWTSGVYLQRALEYMGVDFDYVNNNQVLEQHFNLSHFDAAIVVDDGFGIQHLPNLPANSVYWNIDGHRGMIDYKPEALRQYRILYTAQNTYGVKAFKDAGFEARWLPLAWDSVGVPYAETERDIPISFIAHLTTEQRWFLAPIVQYKYGGFAGERFHGELGGLLSRSKISLNAFGGFGTIDPTDLNGRTFDIMGCGALLLQPQMDFPDLSLLGFNGVDGWWMGHSGWERRNTPNGAHYVFWKDASQLFRTIEYYLAEGGQEGIDIAARGAELVRKEHTFIRRAERILADMGIS